MRQRRGRSVRLLLLLLLLLLVLVVMHRTVATALALDTIQTRTGRGRAGVGIRLGEVVGRARVAGGRCRGVLVLVELGGRGDCGGVAQLRCRKRHQAAGRGGRQVRRLVHVARWYSAKGVRALVTAVARGQDPRQDPIVRVNLFVN